MINVVLIATSAAWVAFELWLVVFRRSDASATRKDVGTLGRLNLVIYASVTAAAVISSFPFGHLELPPAVRWGGIVLLVAGLALRVWAVRCLSRFFTVDVAIHRDHRLIRSGPYRWVRHPSYSGLLLSFVGLAIGMSNAVSALVLLLPIAAVFVRRIRVEERALIEAFPQEYPEYCARTSRVIPGIY